MQVDIKDIINSGIIEEYVLGTLPEAEVEELNRLREQYPEIEEEIIRTEEAMVLAFSKPAPSAWKQEILSALPGGDAAAATAQAPPAAVQAPANMQVSPRSSYFKWAAVAAGLLLIVSIGLNMKQSGDIKDSLAGLDKMRKDNENMRTELAAMRSEISSKDQALQAMFSPGTQKIVMQGTPAFAQHSSVVYWNPDNGEVFWDGGSLPELPGDNQYQLWAIVDGKPQNGGLFDPARKDMRMLPAGNNPQAFAVTIEPAGGSVNPTLDKMVVVASVTTAKS